MRWRYAGFGVIMVMAIAIHPAWSQSRTPKRRPIAKPPASQGFFMGSSIELRGLRVPLVIKTPAQRTILLLASYWTALTGAKLRVVSAMDHIHARHSAHYSGLAIDFQGEKLNALAVFFRLWGYKVYWKVPGHYQHVHVEEVQDVWTEQSGSESGTDADEDQ